MRNRPPREKANKITDPLEIFNYFTLKGDGCWVWIGAKANTGYGYITHKGKILNSHRLSWKVNIGEIPPGMSVLHKCDNRICVRPDHLFLGTITDNMADKTKKGRQLKGTQMHSSKLTDEDVINIRKQYVPWKVSLTTLGKKYGVHHTTILDVLHGESWKHI